MKICIHIGFPKTGSTALQSHVNANRNWLARRGVYIPNSGYNPGLGHCFLFGKSDISSPPKGISRLLVDTSAIPDLAEEIQACENAGFDTVLLTWEGFSLLDRTLISKMKGCFGNYDVTLFSYVREQADLTQSLILQSIKTGTSSQTIFSYIADDLLTNPWYLDFYAVFSMWKEEFGDQITIRTKIYERNLLLDQDIVADFIDWLGLKSDRHFANQGAHVNHSLDFRAAAVLALAKAAGLRARGMAELSRALLKSNILRSDAQKRFLPKKIIENIRNSNINSNRLLLEKFQPENMTSVQSSEYFNRDAIDLPENEDPIVQVFRELYSIIDDRELEVWHGNILVGHELSRVTNQVGTGWRDSENDGIWSVGESSEIAFQMPTVDSSEGPLGLKLTLAGIYFGSNKSTVVCRHGASTRENLLSAELSIPIDDNIRAGGIHLKLSHDDPTSPLETGTGKSPDKLAFQLRYIQYDFYWEEVCA